MNKDNIKYLCNKLRKVRKADFNLADPAACIMPIMESMEKFKPFLKVDFKYKKFLEVSQTEIDTILFVPPEMDNSLLFYGVNKVEEVTPWIAAKRIQQYADGIIDIHGKW